LSTKKLLKLVEECFKI